MQRVLGAWLALVLLGGLTAAQSRTKTLDIYIVDTEGGKAALFVAPSGETVLVDSGNPGGRDTDRIMAAISDAGVTRIDYLITTHYHVDHVGGMEALASKIPIKHFLDHGPTVEEREQVAGFQQMYAGLYGKASHTVVKAGDTVPVAGLDWRIVTAGGHAVKTALPGGGEPNPYCAEFEPRENPSDPENGQSVGSVIAYGKFRAIDLGDLLWNNEFDLMCPNNPIGQVDLYLVSHHGTDPSGSTALVHAIAPRVAIMQNGTRKGGTVQTYQTLRSAPRIEDIWQLHWSYNGGIEYNPAGVFIANVDDPQTIADVLTSPSPQRGGGPGGPVAPSNPAPISAGARGRGEGPGGHTGPAFLIKVSAQADGTFTVTNTRNNFSKSYR
jgi:beta-lactamase superfamily II metal-dependent hydrolase